MKITFFVVAAILIPHLTNSILFVMKSPQQSKCFYTQHSPDKTLEARLGFLRKERLRCSAIFSVGIIDSEGNMKEKIYSSQHRCEQTKTNEPYVLKHTSENFEYQGLYKVCVEMQFNENENTVVEIFLGEKLNPIIFEHSEQALPLVESADLLNLDLTAQSIKRSLVKSRNFHQQTREKGQKLDLRITEMQSVYTFSSLMQIVCLICFGMAWVAILQKFKRTK